MVITHIYASLTLFEVVKTFLCYDIYTQMELTRFVTLCVICLFKFFAPLTPLQIPFNTILLPKIRFPTWPVPLTCSKQEFEYGSYFIRFMYATCIIHLICQHFIILKFCEEVHFLHFTYCLSRY
jgi:hypothetical protein